MKTIHATLAVVAGLILSACGGGGGSGSGTVGPQGVSVHLATQTRGPTGAEVRDYLAVFASGGPWCRGANCERLEGRQDPGIFRFSKPPLLRIAEGTDGHQRAMILHAVALVNHALPYDNHIRIGEDSPTLAQVQEVPGGQIFVDFARHNDWIPMKSLSEITGTTLLPRLPPQGFDQSPSAAGASPIGTYLCGRATPSWSGSRRHDHRNSSKRLLLVFLE